MGTKLKELASSLGRFVVLAVWPGRSVVGPAFGTAGALALGSAYLTSLFGSKWAVAAVGLLTLAIVLCVFAGTRLQREKDERAKSRFTIEPWVAEASDLSLHTPDNVFARGYTLFAYVRNDGPTARFGVQVTNVIGLPWDNYAVHAPVWEGTTELTPEIGFKQRRRLKLANVALEPRAFWFWTLEHGDEQAGSQFHLDVTYSDAVEAVIRFEMEVTNITAGTSVTKHGRVTVPISSGGGRPTLEFFDTRQ